MSGVAAEDLRSYFAEARRWDEDRLMAAERSKRLAWIIAGCAVILASASVFAVAMLAPLKRVEPFVVRVDKSTGAVDVLTTLSGSQRFTADEAVSKYFLAEYVRAREGWLPQAAAANFHEVSILSTPGEQQRFADAFRPTNPASPQVALGDAGEAQVALKAISFVAPGVASVRFQKLIRHGSDQITSDWIATIAFTYAKAPVTEADRLRNPLGFQVLSYRADPEVTP